VITKEKIRLCRHRDDEYWDEISVHAPLHEGRAAGLGIAVIPRYKSSGLSGDEWRISTRFTLSNRQGTLFERTFHTMKQSMDFGSHFVWKEGKELLNAPNASLVVSRKGHTLWSQQFPTFADAAIGMAWHLCIASEQEDGWRQLTDDEERAHCQQPGCEMPPECLYSLKRIQKGNSHSTLLAPEYDFEACHRWFCARHAERGDCGLEDCDKNYDVIIAIDPRRDPHDVSPSIFGGAITLGKE